MLRPVMSQVTGQIGSIGRYSVILQFNGDWSPQDTVDVIAARPHKAMGEKLSQLVLDIFCL